MPFQEKPNRSFRMPPQRIGWADPQVMKFILNECSDIRKAICGACPSQKLYDKNGKVYSVNRRHTIDEVKKIVEEIRKVNSDGIM